MISRGWFCGLRVSDDGFGCVSKAANMMGPIGRALRGIGQGVGDFEKSVRGSGQSPEVEEAQQIPGQMMRKIPRSALTPRSRDV